ncbi:hypothetical protein FO440_18515 [Mucilaginibacter corticis]|uniref:histidine kinase n=1 Tax=Mucilaginibacter corticis TaxID=2597670 RepID=A0A556MIP2_9SPHI|nr:CHASE3 domain-containing protein [Mucilaginibacter corticis]TSJ39732.1 hypothetical protein FO440_18515 [Mucilaginibacter corticis]
MEHRFSRNLKLGYSFSFIMLVAVGLLSYFFIRNLLQSDRAVAHSNAVIFNLERTLSLMKDAETGQRGYLLTGREQFLTPYLGAYPQALQLVGAVTALTRDNAQQQKNMAAVRAVMLQRMTGLEAVVAKKRQGLPVSASDLDAGKAAMDSLRKAIERTEQAEQTLLAERSGLLNRYAVWTPVLIIGAILIALAIGLFSYFRVSADIREKDRLRVELQRKEEETAAFNEELTAANEEITAANEELSAINGELAEAREELVAVNENLEQKVKERTRELAASEEETQALNEELVSINEELASANEEYMATNEELLENREALIASEHRARNIVAGAPFPIGVYAGREMRIVMANKAILDVWGKGSGVIGQTYYEILPELEGSGIYEQLDRVFMTGEAFHARNQRVDIVVDGKLQPYYFNYSFTPLLDTLGQIYGVMNTAAEITDLVMAKEQVEQSERELRGIKLQLEAELEVSRELQRQKDDFIGMASHELKTPITSLSAVIQLAQVKLKNNPDPFLAQAMDKAVVQIKRMTGMINGFLNVSRLESGKIEIIKTTFDIGGLLREVVDEIKLTASTHPVVLDNCPFLEIAADRDKISSVISNLVSNAIKYSDKGKTVTVSCSSSPVSVTVSVKDEGMGIAPEDTDKIFDRYYRVKTEHTQHIAGFGIGLYLSAQIVQLHDGRIWVESETGKGSTFYFSLPLG